MNTLRPRRVLRGVATLLLATVVSGLAHWPVVQDECVPSTGEAHDESKHAFAPAVEVHHGHCAICHWQRVHRPAFTQVAVDIAAISCASALGSSAHAVLSQASSARIPARAPPTIRL
jgi:hypothetical protein